MSRFVLCIVIAFGLAVISGCATKTTSTTPVATPVATQESSTAQSGAVSPSLTGIEGKWSNNYRFTNPNTKGIFYYTIGRDNVGHYVIEDCSYSETPNGKPNGKMHHSVVATNELMDERNGEVNWNDHIFVIDPRDSNTMLVYISMGGQKSSSVDRFSRIN